MKTDSVIKILFVEDSVEEAEQIVTLLRNTGIAVRPTHATNAEQIHQALEELGPDLVLFNANKMDLPLRSVAQQIEASARDIALIAYAPKIDEQFIADIFKDGAQGIGVRCQPQQMIAVIQREFESLHTRRQVRRLESALRESERRCDALLDSSNDPIAYVHEGMHVRANRSYLDTFGYEDFDELLSLPVLDLISPHHADVFKTRLRALSRGEKVDSRLEIQVRDADGTIFSATAEFAHATFESEPCLQIVFRRQQTDPNLIERLRRDPVTGLFHRARMLECIDGAVVEANGGLRGQSLLLIEPDNWTQIVNGIGLGKADELLAAFARRVSTELRVDDVVGLLAEHTIGVILHTEHDEAIHSWVKRLQHAISSEIFDLGTQSITLSVSIGGSLLGEKNANTDMLLMQASQALRSAQSQGGQRCELHDPAEREKADAERERNWLGVLRQALVENEFVLYHQHTISLQDAEGDYSEILLRMNGPQDEVLPGFFMPIAEKYGLCAEIDRWVLEQAINALKARERGSVFTTFFVKLNLESLQQQATLLPWLEKTLKQANLKRGRLVLEMTESKVVTLLRPAQEFVTAWKQMGGQFALEQFGSGLNSFQLLNHIDADYLKIDRVFMANLPQHPENQRKIAEICQQAHEMKRLTIAEWVEDAVSTSALFACGVDFVQGNFLQEPEPLIVKI